ncbi:MAG: DUF4038 domain-containing protein [Candidatus Latescibacterota bacterium]
MKFAIQNGVSEWAYTSGKKYADPFNEVQLDVVFADADGREKRVPAFWSGEQVWRVRYSSPEVGRVRYRTECSDAGNADLHGQEGALDVQPYEGANPLFAHGPLRVSENQRHFEHLDGTPFFWLGDTWWMGFTRRLDWPGGFHELTADRVSKGVSVIQIVAGLYPDMPPFDERGANEAGFPWEPDYARINPAYFDMADLRMDYLVRNGLVPCVVACWGYFLKWMGVEKIKQHWRYLIARWGAYPTVWCLAGEGNMPYYLSEDKEQDQALLRKGWTEVGAWIQGMDPYDHPVTIHPGSASRHIVDDPGVLDFEMLQTGHGDRSSLPNTVKVMAQSYSAEPRMPVLNSEVCYEGIGEQCRQEVQRIMFWTSILSGGCGHTYGANGIWQVNGREKPYGPSPHGMAWGNTPWEDAMKLPGSGHLGLAKKLLERYDWWDFQPHPEWIDPHSEEEDFTAPYAAGIPGVVRIIYFPTFPWCDVRVTNLEKDGVYEGFLFNPASGETHPLGEMRSDSDNACVLQKMNASGPLRLTFPLYQDWLLVMEAR